MTREAERMSRMNSIEQVLLKTSLKDTYGEGRSHLGKGVIIHQLKDNICRIRYARSSRFSNGILIERFNDHEEKKVFHQEFQLVGIHGMVE